MITCHIMLVRSKLLGASHPMEGMTQECHIKRKGSLGAISKAPYHTKHNWASIKINLTWGHNRRTTWKNRKGTLPRVWTFIGLYWFLQRTSDWLAFKQCEANFSTEILIMSEAYKHTRSPKAVDCKQNFLKFYALSQNFLCILNSRPW